MTGAQILEVVNHAQNLAGTIQPAGLEFKYFAYKDANPGPQPYAWGAFDCYRFQQVYSCTMNRWTEEDLQRRYQRVPGTRGGDGYSGFKYMTNITYWGDMLNAVNAFVSTHYGTPETAYMGPNGTESRWSYCHRR